MPLPPARIALIAAGLFALASTVGAARLAWRWPDLPDGVAAPKVPADNPMSSVKVALGRRLFYDPALSGDGSMACADCHVQARGFTDGAATHVGVTGEMGIRNVPGLANVAWRPALTWTEANITSLESQAMVPMTGTAPVEMGMAGKEGELSRRLGDDACYQRLFALAFPGSAKGADFTKVSAALGAFQRTMIAFATPFDRFVSGDPQAMTAQATKGFGAFKSAGCAACHSGRDLTDAKVHYVGTAAPREADDPAYGGKPLPPGFVPPPDSFRTPSLRNVAVTGPWLHDGSAASAEEAIRRHAAASIAGLDLPAMLAFLDSLTDREFLRASHLSKPGGACPVTL